MMRQRMISTAILFAATASLAMLASSTLGAAQAPSCTNTCPDALKRCVFQIDRWCAFDENGIAYGGGCGQQ